MPVPAMKSLSVLAASALLPFTASLAQEAAPASETIIPVAADGRLTPQQVRADIELAREAFSRVHPGYTRYATEDEMAAQWQAIIDRAEAQGGMSLAEFYLASELALVAIRCDHTKAELPEALREARAGKPLYLPMRWRIVEGRAFVEAGAEGLELQFGDEIISIDGRSMGQLFTKLGGFIPVDGYTEWTRPNEMAASFEFMGGAVDHFGALLWDVPASATLIIRGTDGETRTAKVDRIDFKSWNAMINSSGLARNFNEAVTFERFADDVAYLRVDTFVNYRNPVDPATIYDPIFKALQDEGQGTLILDLRRNGGGSTDANLALLENVLADDYTPRKGMFAKTLDLSGIRQHLTSWDQRALNPDPAAFISQDDGTYALRSFLSDDLRTVEPSDHSFDGKLIVLTSSSNSSGSANFMSWMSELGRATLVGERTGGSKEGPTAGVQFTLGLPHSGVRMRLPIFHVKNNVSSFENGLGVTPDVPAPMTAEDFLEGRDPALEAAIALAKDASDTTAQVFAAASDFELAAGADWSGELEYLNYNSPTRSTIPVRMAIGKMGERSVQYGFAYPGEEHMNASSKLRFSKDGASVDGMIVTDRSIGKDGTLTIVAEGKGEDAGQAADLRFTYSISANAFSIRKDVRFAGGDYFNRNEYRLTR